MHEERCTLKRRADWHNRWYGVLRMRTAAACLRYTHRSVAKYHQRAATHVKRWMDRDQRLERAGKAVSFEHTAPIRKIQMKCFGLLRMANERSTVKIENIPLSVDLSMLFIFPQMCRWEDAKFRLPSATTSDRIRIWLLFNIFEWLKPSNAENWTIASFLWHLFRRIPTKRLFRFRLIQRRWLVTTNWVIDGWWQRRKCCFIDICSNIKCRNRILSSLGVILLLTFIELYSTQHSHNGRPEHGAWRERGCDKQEKPSERK